MEWLSQNWGILLLVVAVIAFMRFGGMGCGHGGRHAHDGHRTDRDEDAAAPPKSTDGSASATPGKPEQRQHRGGC